MNLARVRQTYERYGAAAAIHDLTKKAVNRVVPLRILRTMRLVRERVDPTFFALPEELTGGFLSEAELLAHASDSSLDIDPSFVRASLAEGDRCYGITARDGRLVSYGWYASRPTPMDESLSFHFDRSYVYMYKGFTRPEYRGQRLHAIGMAQALVLETDRGSKGILSYVESNNFASLKSCYRMGYEPIGTIVVLTLADRPMSLATPGCRTYGVDVQLSASGLQ